MARKKNRFQWTGDADELPQRAERRDQNEARLEKRQLTDLALRLARLTAGELERLELDELLVDEIVMLAGLGAQSARRRQLLRVQGLLRGVDVSAVEARLAGSSRDDARLRALERWRGVLIAGGDAELEAYLGAHPSADRQRLRSLVRRARGEGPTASKAARRLFQVMKADVPVDEG